MEERRFTFSRLRKIVINTGHQNVGFKGRHVDIFITKSDFLEGFNRTTVRARGNTSINKLLVVYIFIRQVKHGVVAKAHLESRIDRHAIPIEEVTMILQPFQHGIESEPTIVASCPIGIDLNATTAKSVGVAC